MSPVLLLAMLVGHPDGVKTSQTLNEMAEAQKACGVDGITYVQFNNKVRQVYVLVANDIYSRRLEPPVAGSIACSAKIVADRGYKPIVLGTKK